MIRYLIFVKKNLDVEDIYTKPIFSIFHWSKCCNLTIGTQPFHFTADLPKLCFLNFKSSLLGFV